MSIFIRHSPFRFRHVVPDNAPRKGSPRCMICHPARFTEHAVTKDRIFGGAFESIGVKSFAAKDKTWPIVPFSDGP